MKELNINHQMLIQPWFSNTSNVCTFILSYMSLIWIFGGHIHYSILINDFQLGQITIERLPIEVILQILKCKLTQSLSSIGMKSRRIFWREFSREPKNRALNRVGRILYRCPYMVWKTHQSITKHYRLRWQFEISPLNIFCKKIIIPEIWLSYTKN